MKIRYFDLFSGIFIAAISGALIVATPYKIMGVILVVFAYGWATGYFTNGLYEEEQERGAEHDRDSRNTGLPVAYRKSI